MRASDVKIGDIYGNALVLGILGKHKNGYTNFRAKCQVCGSEYIIHNGLLGKTEFCRHCKTWYKIPQIQGKRFGKLVAIEKYDTIPNGNGTQIRWLCKCDCGTTTITTTSRLLNGMTRSCGCSRAESLKTLGLKRSQEHIKQEGGTFEYKGKLRGHPNYHCYLSMICRCTRKSNDNYKNYGGRGIKVCDRWLGHGGFIRFVEDMGERPSPKHSIDRIDVNGDYCPENCRWATFEEQYNNKSDNVFLYFGEKRLSVSQFSRRYKMRRSLVSILALIRKGYDINYIIKIDATYSHHNSKPHDERYRNHNRVVSEEVMKLLENINTNSDEQNN